MEERSSHLTVVVGASTIAEELRRSLVQHGVAHAGVTTHLRGLRKSFVLGDSDLVVVCIALDSTTLKRHGEALQHMLADHQCFPQTVRSVGLLTEIGLTGDIARMGCDLYVHDSEQAASAVQMLAGRWQTQRVAPTASAQTQRDVMQKAPGDAWLWGTAKLPVELESLVKDQSSTQSSQSDSN